MKRKLLITITVILTLAVVIGIFAGCTESLKQDKIATEYSGTVESNGGLAVVYGKYLYFINGFAGESVDNSFGKVVKGAVCRVVLEDGVPTGDVEVIVPKNVYGTDTKYGGIYISNDYIYYATTSTKLDGNGNPKTSECAIMRTKVDGTDTKEILNFDSHSVVFKVVGDKLVYIRDNGIYSVDLSSKKFDVTTVEESIVSGYIMDEENVYYNVYVDGDSANYAMKVYTITSGTTKTILSAEVYGKTDVKYTFGLLSVVNDGEGKVRLFYSKKDNLQGNPEEGIYSLVCDKSDMKYESGKEVAFTRNSSSTTNLNYTQFYKAGNYYLGFASTKIDVFNGNGERLKLQKGEDLVIASINVGTSFTVFSVEENADSVELWYWDASENLRKLNVLEKEDGEWKFVERNESKVCNICVDGSYVNIEKINGVLYYFNGDVSKNAYYYVIGSEEEEGKLLGKITEEDIVASF